MKPIFPFSLLILLGFSSCKKESLPIPEIPVSGYSSKDFTEIVGQLVNTKADFQITISSSIGSGVYQTATVRNGSTIVEAFCTSRRNVGSLIVNNQLVPFAHGFYSYQPDTSQTSIFATGRGNTYELRNGSFPNFVIRDYAPALPIIKFDGIVDYKFPIGSDLTISWTPDPKFPLSGKSAIIVSYQEEQSTVITTFHKEVDQSSGTATLTSSELALFEDKPYVKIYFANGSSTKKKVGDKTVAISNLAFSYSKIYRK